MTIGVGNLVAIICIVISVIFAIVTNQATNALSLPSSLSYGGGHEPRGAAARLVAVRVCVLQALFLETG
jgi:hypothetical protein